MTPLLQGKTRLTANAHFKYERARRIALVMKTSRTGLIAVIFSSTRTADDPSGYLAAATLMEELASAQPGYRGLQSVRDAQGLGITISYWESDAHAKAWRDHPEHTRIRELGRQKWYSEYQLEVAQIERDYHWSRNA